MTVVVAALVLALFGCCALADETTHRYTEGEEVKLWANKVGPFNNPLETYEYFNFPFCPPGAEEWNQRFPSLGEALQGDELVEHKHLGIKFKLNVERAKTCSQPVTADQVAVLKQAIAEQYWYQFYLDDLPVWATIGKMVDKPNTGTGSSSSSSSSSNNKEPQIYLHQHLQLGYNGDQIVLANLTADGEAPLPENGGTLEFVYSVSWQASPVKYENRFRRYLDNQFFEHKIHWFSIFNSFMMVLFLVLLVVTILSRTLKADYARYAREHDEEDRDTLVEDSGWKQVHADVFRVPTHPCLFAALVGTGNQLVLLSLAIILIALVVMIYTSRGALLTYCVVVWALTSYVAGHSSGSQFMQYSLIVPAYGPLWIRTMLMTGTVFPAVCVLVVWLMNFVAWGYHSSQAIPFLTMIVVLVIWFLAAFPLVILGTIVGRNARKYGGKEVPRVAQIPRNIPPKPWYLERWVFVLGGGVLPFGSIFIELYFVFTSFWNYKFYYVYGFMLLVFVILVVVTVCVSVVAAYFLLNSEDHRWQWTAFGAGASTGLYMFGYAVYFFFTKTKMTGLLMTTLYFGYMALFSFGFALLTGSVAFLAASVFVRRIYNNIKLD